jgi:hypothetical protein
MGRIRIRRFPLESRLPAVVRSTPHKPLREYSSMRQQPRSAALIIASIATAWLPRGRRRLGLAVVLLAAIAALVVGADAQVPSLTGRYAFTDVMKNDDEVIFTLTVGLFNQAYVDVLGARLALERPGAPENATVEDSDGAINTFGPVDVHAREGVRFTRRCVVSASEWTRWQRGIAPRFRVSFHDDEGAPVHVWLSLTQVSEMPDEPVIF